MTRIASQNFSLNIGGTEHFYKAGEPIKKEHAEHWYAQAHSNEIETETKTETKASGKKKAEKAVEYAPVETETKAGEPEAPKE